MAPSARRRIPWGGVIALLAAWATCGAQELQVELAGYPFTVEVAATREAQARGLSKRFHLASERGMLFPYPMPRPVQFWMKDTWIPLDILFFDAQQRLVRAYTDVPPCRADPCPRYPSTVPVRYVLELAAGTAARIGVKPGERLIVPESLSLPSDASQ